MIAPTRTRWLDRRISEAWPTLASVVVMLVAGVCALVLLFAIPEPSGPATPGQVPGHVRDSVQVLDAQVKGQTVTCIYIPGQREAALSCNWQAGR